MRMNLIDVHCRGITQRNIISLALFRRVALNRILATQAETYCHLKYDNGFTLWIS